MRKLFIWAFVILWYAFGLWWLFVASDAFEVFSVILYLIAGVLFTKSLEK